LANSPKLTADSSLTESIAVAATPPSDDKADECSDPGADGYRFIRMLMHGFVGGLRGLDHLVPGPARDFLGMFKCGGQALAGLLNFFSGHVGGSCHQGATVFEEPNHIIADCLCIFVHVLGLSLFIDTFQ
jgi:hypothetical protein